MKALLFNRWNKFLHALNLYTCEQFCEINGEDYIDIETDEPLAKGDRIVIYDGNQQWLEYVFNEGEQVHEGGQTYKMTCENSLMWDLSLKHIRYTGWNSANAQYALTELLRLHPLWSAGQVLSTPAKKLVYERESLYQALLETCGAFNCEIKKTITMGKTGILKREVSLVGHIGVKRSIRFDYKDGLFGVKKTINSDPVLTAVYGYGSGIDDNELWCYVRNDEVIKLWGLPDGNGAIHHAEGDFTDNDIEDMASLQQAATDYLNNHSAPSITYETNIPFAAIEGALLGDTIQVVDTEFNPPLRLDTRIGAMERDLLTNVVTKAVFGNVISYLPDALARSYDQEKVIIRQTAVIGELKSDLKDSQSQLHSTQNSLSEAQRNVSDLQRRLQSAETALGYAEADLEEALENAAAAKNQANDLAVIVDRQESTLTAQQSDITQMKEDVKGLLAGYAAASNGLNGAIDLSNIYLNNVVNGSPLNSDTRRIAQVAYYGYSTSGYRQSPGIEYMYQQIMALPVSDEGGEEPSIGDVQPGEGSQIMGSDTDKPDTTE